VTIASWQVAVARPALLLCLLLASACNDSNSRAPGPQAQRFRLNSLAKTDIGQVLEVHVHEARGYLRELMIKLYRRNPRELAKSPVPDAEQNIRRLFDEPHQWQFPELDGTTGVAALRLGLAADYDGDRVFAFVAGLLSMVMSTYEYKEEFYLLDSVDPQNLYNSARNIEIASWKLRHDRGPDGEPVLYSVSLPGEVENLSYERLFGKLIALQDTMAVIIAGKGNRTITKMVQRMATAAFLPIF